jgi:hypothetical protein
MLVEGLSGRALQGPGSLKSEVQLWDLETLTAAAHARAVEMAE